MMKNNIMSVAQVTLKMKVVLLIFVLINISSTRLRSPGMVRNWDNSLVGLDFLAFGKSHDEFHTKVNFRS